MKRREFLTATMSMAGSLVPGGFSANAASPCPPPQLGVSGGGSIETSCGGTSTAPDWFVNAPVGQWLEIARHSEGKSVGAVLPNPLPTHSVDFEGPPSIARSFGGGVVDQGRGELLLPQRGGHTQYCGNECYALALRTSDPRWYRLCDPTPSSYIRGDNGSGNWAYNDGRMRSVHGWSRVAFANDRVWHPTLDSAFCATGDAARWTWAYHRAAAGTPVAPGGAPLAWRTGIGPFEDYGAPPATDNGWPKGVCIHDRNSGLLWTFNGGGSPSVWTFDTRALAQGRAYFEKSGSASLVPYTAWGVHAHDLGYFFAALPIRASAYVGTDVLLFDPADPVNGWQRKTPANSFGNWMTSGGGMVSYGAAYHREARAIYCFNSADPGVIRILDLPQNPLSGTYAWRSYRPAGVVPSGALSAVGTYGNFGIIENMGQIAGATRQALVLFRDVYGPSYVMKLPPGSLS